MKANTIVGALAVFLVLPLSGCGRPDDPEPVKSPFDTVLIVLGNEPLDDQTPTVDTIARVAKAVAFQEENPATLLVFTGGPTAGTRSEARMMADLAVARGVSMDSIRLEEKARSTGQNARLTAELIRQIHPRRIFIVSKSDHLEWATPIFKRVAEFKSAEPLACRVDRADSIAQMEAYLKTHDSARVRRRLQQLKKGVKGVD